VRDEVKIEDLHPKYQMIARIIGVDNALKLGEEIGGEALYLPKLTGHRSPLLKLRNRRIYAQFDGSNVLQLSKKYGITPRRIYAILTRERENRRGLTKVG
jgi:Mor family transcriptional regulator